jgi:hypothetical protein
MKDRVSTAATNTIKVSVWGKAAMKILKCSTAAVMARVNEQYDLGGVRCGAQLIFNREKIILWRLSGDGDGALASVRLFGRGRLRKRNRKGRYGRNFG